MKRIATNMTLGQLLFVLLSLIISSLMFFYLGAKFGADILSLAEKPQTLHDKPFLPDEKLVKEVEQILSEHNPKLVFHEAVQSEQTPSPIKAATVKPVKEEIPEKGEATKPVVEEETPAKVLLPPTSKPRNYRLQVGSFTNERKALDEKLKWESRGFPVVVLKQTLPGNGLVYRLQIGLFESLPDVQAAQKGIKIKYGQAAAVSETE